MRVTRARFHFVVECVGDSHQKEIFHLLGRDVVYEDGGVVLSRTYSSGSKACLITYSAVERERNDFDENILEKLILKFKEEYEEKDIMRVIARHKCHFSININHSDIKEYIEMKLCVSDRALRNLSIFGIPCYIGVYLINEEDLERDIGVANNGGRP